MKWLRLWAVLLLSTASNSEAAGPLNIAVTNSWSEPLLVSEHGEISGLFAETVQALAQALHRPMQLTLLPAKRVRDDLQHGAIDGACFIAPQWLPFPSEHLLWTPPLFEEADVLVSRRTAPRIRALEQLQGQQIGTVLGYRYPLLDTAARAGRLQRDDAPNSTLNLRKLLEGRFTYMTWKESSARWYIKQHPEANLIISPLVLEKSPLRCVFTARAGLSLEQLQQAVQQLEHSGQLRAINQRYR